jgi:xanthine dehydrogenase accessory factor
LLEGLGRERFVVSTVDGIWSTRLAIGASVLAGTEVGAIDGLPVHAPVAGLLRGLARSGVSIKQGQRLLEVDPREQPQVFGLGERPMAIAKGACQALGLE